MFSPLFPPSLPFLTEFFLACFWCLGVSVAYPVQESKEAYFVALRRKAAPTKEEVFSD